MDARIARWMICLAVSASPALAQNMAPAMPAATEPSMQSPASAPATAPIAADSTTPKGTLVLLSRATAAGDSEKVSSLLSVNTPGDRKLADALMSRNIANVRFRTAAAKSFGEEIATQMAGSANDDESRIAQASVDIVKDQAVVNMGDGGEKVNLINIDGVWKLSLAGLTTGMSDEQVDSQLSKMKIVSDVVTDVTGDLSAGKFKSPDELGEAIRTKLAAAAHLATSQPTTGPTTMPG